MPVSEGWLTQPDGSKKYRTSDGKLHNTNPSNWTSYPGQPSIDAAVGTNLTRGAKFVGGLFSNPTVQNTAINIGSMLSPVPIAGAVGAGLRQNSRATSIATGQGDPQAEPSAPAPKQQPNNGAVTQQPSLTGRDEQRGGSTGTQMSPKGPDFPALLQSLQAQGMNLGYQSVTMPTQGQANSNQTVGLGSATIASGINAGRTVNANDPKFQAYLDGEERIGDTEVTFEPGKAEVVSQTALDSTDQSRAISGGLSDALNDKEGMRSYMKNLYGGRDAQYDRRGAAFLNGGPDSMLALRAAEYSQRYMVQNGVNVAIDAQGNPIGTFSDEGKQKLINQGYGTANSQEFLDQYQVASGLKNSQTAQSTDSVAPGPASTMNPLQIASQQYTPLDQADFQPKDKPVLGNGPEVDLNTNYFAPGSNMMFNGNLREPLMRYK